MREKLLTPQSLKVMGIAALGAVVALGLLLGIYGAGRADGGKGARFTGALASEGKNWKILIEPDTDGRVGQEMKTTLHLLPKRETGFKFNLDYPTRIRLVDPSGNLKMATTRLERKDALTLTEEGATFHLLYTPATAGTFTAEAVVTYGVCVPKRCQIAHDTIRWKVQVRDSGGDDGTKGDQGGTANR